MVMTQADQAARDLEFVRGAVQEHDQSGAQTMPASVGLMWAAIILVGCVGNDFLPQWSWLFWVTAAPVGSMMCGVLAGRRATQMGEIHNRMGMLNGLHWSSLFWMPVPIVMLALTRRIDENTCGIMMLMVSGIVWYLGGVHLDRRWMLPGIAMVVAAAILVWVHKYSWTIAGIIGATSLIISFIVIGPKPAVASEHE
jgi:hypothetical protein